ncbi:unnamed protein product [Phytophthora lilii]|uniref:Unnamed protein product n=1 Tax=Phytophthora lilii TaxID=2077276 RepID=A0A9W6X8A3_9STRA|nr:unnamed protein product [Phytophthora lilii]
MSSSLPKRRSQDTLTPSPCHDRTGVGFKEDLPAMATMTPSVKLSPPHSRFHPAPTMQSVNLFSDAYCSSPLFMEVTSTSSCSTSECSTTVEGTSTYYYTTTCPSNAFSNGSAKLQYFVDSACSLSLVDPVYISEDLLTSHTCYIGSKYYSNSEESATNGVSSTSSDSNGTTTSSSSSSGSNVGLIAGIAAGCVVLVLLFVGRCCWRRRRNKNKEQHVRIRSPATFEQVITSSPQFQQIPDNSVKNTTGTDTLSSAGGSMISKL